LVDLSNMKVPACWTSSLDKAIWYAAHHAAFYDLSNCAAYVTIIPASEIYCCLDHYDYDCDALPSSALRVDVPAQEFGLDTDLADENHRIGVGLGHGVAGELAVRAAVGLEQKRLCLRCYSACKIDPHLRGIGVEN
jgi:hypothetical protein